MLLMNQHDPKFDPIMYENMISAHLNNYLNNDQFIYLNIPILYRIITKFHQKIQDEKIIIFLFKCLDKYGKNASVLFSNVDLCENNYLIRLVNDYSSVFDFNFITSSIIRALRDTQNELQKSQKNYINLHDDHKLLLNKYNTLDKNCKSLQNKYQEIKDENQTLKIKYQKLHDENQRLLNENKAIKDKLQILQKEHQSLLNENKAIKDKLQILQNKHQSLLNENKAIKDKHQTLQTEHQSYQNEYKNIQNKLDDKINKEKMLEKEINELKEKRVDLNDPCNFVINENREFYILSYKNNNYCFDVENGSKNEGSNVLLAKFNRSASQRWRIRGKTIVSVNSNLVLDVCVEKYSGGQIIQYHPNNGDNQHWIFCNDGTIRIAHGFYCIDSLNGNIFCNGYTGSNGQKWKIYYE